MTKQNESQIIVTGDVGNEIFVYVDKLPSKPKSLRKAVIKEFNQSAKTLPGCADAFVVYLNALHGREIAINPCKPEDKRCKDIICVSENVIPNSAVYILTKEQKIVMEQKEKTWRIELAYPYGEREEIEHCKKNLTDLVKNEFDESTPALLVDFNQGWRKFKLKDNNSLNDMKLFLEKRPYIIRTNDPTFDEWRKLREKFNGEKSKGIWFSPITDMDKGNLWVSCVWEDIQVIDYLKNDETLWKDNKWLHYIVILISAEGILILGPDTNENGILLIMPKEQPESFSMRGYGKVKGRNIIFVSSLAKAILQPNNNEISLDKIKNSAKEGLYCIRKFIELGFVDLKEINETYKTNLPYKYIQSHIRKLVETELIENIEKIQLLKTLQNCLEKLVKAGYDLNNLKDCIKQLVEAGVINGTEKMEVRNLQDCIGKLVVAKKQSTKLQNCIETLMEHTTSLEDIQKQQLTLDENCKDSVEKLVLTGQKLRDFRDFRDCIEKLADFCTIKDDENDRNSIPLYESDQVKGISRIITFAKQKERNNLDDAFEIVLQEEEGYNRRIVLEIEKLITASPDHARKIIRLAGQLEENLHYEDDKIYSCAIFGEPGSGKSSIPIQLVEAIKKKTGKKISDPLTYNLSQFKDMSNLIIAFKEIQKYVLKGEIPFVIWDEFDIHFQNNECGWLSYFLMPMQDSKFFDGKENSNLGKCIFIFIGGTFNDENSFIEWTQKEENKRLKGKDFHSRLDSSLTTPSIDVHVYKETGIINEKSEARTLRAIMLRQFLKDSTSVEDITIGVLIYLLHVPLQHGVRSLSKIVKNSELSHASTFQTKHFPPLHTLKLHVKNGGEDVNTFLNAYELNSKWYDKPLHLEWRAKREYKITDELLEYLQLEEDRSSGTLSRGEFLRSLRRIIGNKLDIFNKPVILEKAKQK